MDKTVKRDDKAGDDWSWETEILARYPSGVDVNQIEERLKLTPTERLEKMRQFLEFLEGAKHAAASASVPYGDPS